MIVRHASHGGRRYRYVLSVDRLASDEHGTVLDFSVEELPPPLGERIRRALAKALAPFRARVR